MIKVNLLAERKPTKAPTASRVRVEGAGSSRNLVLVGILLIGFAAAGGWWWSLDRSKTQWTTKITEAEAELKRLEEARKKGEQFEAHKTLLARKIELITDLKKQQSVPVYILDQVSKNIPEFLWLDSMASSQNNISITGKATTYNAVSNFYSNLNDSGYFGDVTLGRTFEVPEGVAFSLTCGFVAPGDPPPGEQG